MNNVYNVCVTSNSMEVDDSVEHSTRVLPCFNVLPVLSTFHVTIFDISSSVSSEYHFPDTTIPPNEDEVSISQVISFHSTCL